MWSDGTLEWILIVSGYVLALGLFVWLGGISRAGEAIKGWGRWTSTRGDGARRI